MAISCINPRIGVNTVDVYGIYSSEIYIMLFNRKLKAELKRQQRQRVLEYNDKIPRSRSKCNRAHSFESKPKCTEKLQVFTHRLASSHHVIILNIIRRLHTYVGIFFHPFVNIFYTIIHNFRRWQNV
jgi:hypothetical protein